MDDASREFREWRSKRWKRVIVIGVLMVVASLASIPLVRDGGPALLGTVVVLTLLVGCALALIGCAMRWWHDG